MAPILLLLFVITLSLVVTRIASSALTLTGMSRDMARFQARSAFTGVGFTTSEAESITTHPVRRRIVMLLMMLGNAGIVTVAATLIIGFTESGGGAWWRKLLALVGGLALLTLISNSRWVDNRVSGWTEWALRRWSHMEVRDYVALLHFAQGFGIVEFEVEEGDWMANNTLASLALPEEGVLVLGMSRVDGTYLGAPGGDAEVNEGDVLTLYGRIDRLDELHRRRTGVAGVYARVAAVQQRQQEMQQRK